MPQRAAESEQPSLISASAEEPPKPRVLPLMLGAIAVFVLTLAGMRLLKSNWSTTPPTTETARHAAVPASATSPERIEPEPTTSVSPPAGQIPSAPTEDGEPAIASSDIHEELPNVPRRAAQTIRGHVRVAVRVIVDKDGTVFAALTDKQGPSRYFERLALQASEKWTFAPTDSEKQRIMRVRFSFTRAGTTARANSLQ